MTTAGVAVEISSVAVKVEEALGGTGEGVDNGVKAGWDGAGRVGAIVGDKGEGTGVGEGVSAVAFA